MKSGDDRIQVRGYTSHNTPAIIHLISLSRVIDACAVALIVLVITSYLKITPTPRLSLLLILGVAMILYWVPQKKFFGLTLGERAWLLKPKKQDSFSLRERLYQRDFFSPRALLGGTLITAISLVLTVILFSRVVLNHPNWMKTEAWKLPSFVPNEKEWVVTPFFYLLGGWPKSFQGKPIFYTLPYEVGPPTRFVGHVIAYWEHPDISVTFEGPKTPEIYTTPSELKNCFTGGVYSLVCLNLRENVLSRHIQEIQNSHQFTHWSMKWFQVENPLIPSDEAPHGVYLSAIGKSRTQDRFILMNGNGTHQTLILRRPNNARGLAALELFKNSIGSIRNFGELGSGKAWINQQLETTQLGDLGKTQDPSTRSIRLGEIQQKLISRITVDPADFNSYFHLAGTSVLLAQAAAEHRLRLKAAQDNLESAERYAHDVAPSDPRIGQFLVMEAEMKKNLSK